MDRIALAARRGDDDVEDERVRLGIFPPRRVDEGRETTEIPVGDDRGVVCEADEQPCRLAERAPVALRKLGLRG